MFPHTTILKLLKSLRIVLLLISVGGVTPGGCKYTSAMYPPNRAQEIVLPATAPHCNMGEKAEVWSG